MLQLIAFAVGITATNFIPTLPSHELSVALLLASLVVIGLSKRFDTLALADDQLAADPSKPCGISHFKVSVLVCASFVLGLSWHLNWANLQLDRLLPRSLEQVEILVSGKINSIPQHNDNYEQFEFLVEGSEYGFFPRTVLLNNYGEAFARAGDRWQLTLRLRRPHGLANPKGFDYEAFLMQRGISARGTVVGSAATKQLAARWSLTDLRFDLHSRLSVLVEGLPNGGILLALALGERGAIPTPLWELFSNSGTTHLLVISGLHIGFAAALGYRFLLLLASAAFTPSRLLLRCPAVTIAAVGGIAAATAYSALAGFSLPTQRALVMVTVLACGTLLRRRFDPLGSLLLALCLCLVLNPMAPLSAGLWFSFVAVAALLQLANSAGEDAQGRSLSLEREQLAPGDRVAAGAVELRRWLLLSMRAQFCVFLALFLPLMFWLGEVSIIAPLANFVAIPLVGFITVPLCLTSIVVIGLWPALAGFLLGLASLSVSALVSYLGFIQALTNGLGAAGFDGSLEIAPVAGPSLVLLACFFFLQLLPRGWPGKSLSVLLLLPAIFPRETEFPGSLEIHILDVGQGLAAVVRSEDKFLLYDAGPAFPGGIDTGSEVVVPVLRSLGARQLDALVISHGDNDHAGGVAGVLRELPVRRLYATEDRLLKRYEVPLTEHCHAGEGWVWGGTRFDFLHPSELLATGNNNSCVLRIHYRGMAILLPGDIESRTELALAADAAKELEAVLLLAPHHGSNTSSTYAFLKNINPYYSITSTGYLNRFGHPAAEVLARLSTLGIAHLNTADNGMISFTLDESGLSPPRRYREYAKRYWYP